MARVTGALILALGLWIFLFPFVGPVFGLYLATRPMSAGSHMGSMGMTPSVIVNQAMVFSNFLPGVVLGMIGTYHLFKERVGVTSG